MKGLHMHRNFSVVIHSGAIPQTTARQEGQILILPFGEVKTGTQHFRVAHRHTEWRPNAGSVLATSLRRRAALCRSRDGSLLPFLFNYNSLFCSSLLAILI